MIAPDLASAQLAAADDKRIGARENEYLTRYELDDIREAMARAITTTR